MKQVLGMVWFSFAMLCVVILLSFGNSKTVSVETEEEWVIPLSDVQVGELNEYFSALTVTHFLDYEAGEEHALQLLSFSSYMLELEYPAMVEQMFKNEEVYVAFDKKMMKSLIDHYFNEDLVMESIYIDLGDYVARPEIPVHKDAIYPEVYQCQQNEDGTYTIDLDLYELEDKTLGDQLILDKGWSMTVDCHKVGAATVVFEPNGDSGYITSYHPIYWK